MNRETHGGKGDTPRIDTDKYRNALFWVRSECCNAHVRETKKGLICQECNETQDSM